ncbi:MAG: 2-C-methyl-D-erythritol 4-phosphate cytidylyltransferase [Oscillospiraceae bacterium]|nr:2-C-methyl-D-erythritol 4-phosphate cytidylyltransferase [Oscillospiraceae bacterium]
MNSGLPKQFLTVCGKPIIIICIENFIKNKNIDEIVVAIPEKHIDFTSDLIKGSFCRNTNIHVICGGDVRNETLVKAVSFTKENFKTDGDTIFLTHDGVRPFINDRIIDENIKAAREYGACTTAIPAVDTIFESEKGDFAEAALSRETLYHVQTPQTFNFNLLCKFLSRTDKKELEKMTDACSIFLQNGYKIKLVTGDRQNIKITHFDDLSVAEAFYKLRIES